MQQQKKKLQTDAINLIDDILDEDNPFRNIDTEDIWIEDGLFNNFDTQAIKNILKEKIDVAQPSDGGIIAIDVPKKSKNNN